MGIQIKNLDKLNKRLDNIVENNKLEQSMGKACALVEGSAKEKAPKDTGALIRSITSKVDYQGDNIVGTVYTPLEYAPYIEYGTGLFATDNNGRKDVPWNYQDDKGNWHSTSGMKPRPFMKPSLNDNVDEIIDLLKEGLKND